MTAGRRLSPLRAPILTLLCLLAAAPPGRAQLAPVFLEPGHWSWDAVRRLHAAGLAPAAGDRAAAPLTVRHALSVFDAAATTAATASRPAFARLAREYRDLLLAETDTTGTLTSGALRAGWSRAAGEALAGDGYLIFEDWEGARPLPDASSPAAGWRGHGNVARRVAWSLDAGYFAEDLVLRSAVLSAALGPVDVWGGRRRLQYALGRGGATTLGGALNDVPDLAHRTAYTFQGLGIQGREAFQLPGFLGILGETRIEAAAGRIARAGRVDGPYVAFGRFMLTPFTERLSLGVSRGAMFAGEGIPITAGRLFGLLYGAHGGAGGEFENQVFAALASLRPPLGPRLPLLLYVEYGMDDTAGAVRDTPGIVAGADLAAVPGLPRLALGVERTSFPQSCCGNPIWYRHIFYRGSWADEGRLLAHPLGGHGREWLVHARFDMPGAGLLVQADMYSRRRYHENLFALERMGRSVGGRARVDYRLAGGTALQVDAALEHASDWTVSRFTALVSRPLGWRP